MDLRERICEYVRECRARGETVTVRRLIKELGISSYRFYQLFPGGLGEVLKSVEESTEPEANIYSKAFKLIESGASPCDLVIELGLEPSKAEEIYRAYHKLMGIDLGCLESRIEELERENAALKERLEYVQNELDARIRYQATIRDLAYRSGYEDGLRDGKKKAVEFFHKVFEECYPELSKFDMYEFFYNVLEMYRAKKLKEELEERV